MGEVVDLDEHRECELLASLNVFRQPNGSIQLSLTYMAPRQIESVETIGERFDLLATWLAEGKASLSQQALELKEPNQ